MPRKMLINVTQAEESRVAIVDSGLLESIEIETGSRENLKGNIYKGVVESVNNSLQAAFVRFSSGRTGFLPLDEINFKALPARRRSGKAGKSGDKKPDRLSRSRGGGKTRIGDLLQNGQELLVQVIREGFASKPPSLSTFHSLPGRFLVLLPGSESSGISRKIEDDKGRDRIKKILKGLSPPEGMGLIVRTAGMDQTKAELTRDLRYLTRLWSQIEKASAKAKAPTLIYQERDLVLRAIRDLFSPDIKEVLIDDEEMYKRALRYFTSIMPGKQKRVKLYDGEEPLFSLHNLEDQIETIYRRQVPLKSGGAIVIDETEALTSIDVNSGKTREANIEDTACKANLEAASEIARQLRLRDIGGLVVIDFIDMRSRSNIRSVEKRLKDAMKLDRARHDLTRISKLGLMEMSRQRLKATTASSTYETCPECEGGGVVKTVESAALSLLRRIHTRCARGDLARVRVLLPTQVGNYLLNRKREELLRLEQRYQTAIQILGRADMRAGDVQVDAEPRQGGAGEEGRRRRDEEPRVKHVELEEAEAEKDGKRRRRGGRRRRRGGAEEGADADARKAAPEPAEEAAPGPAEENEAPSSDPGGGGEGEGAGAGDSGSSDSGRSRGGRRRGRRGGRGRRGRRRDEGGSGQGEERPAASGPPDLALGPDDDAGPAGGGGAEESDAPPRAARSSSA